MSRLVQKSKSSHFSILTMGSGASKNYVDRIFRILDPSPFVDRYYYISSLPPPPSPLLVYVVYEYPLLDGGKMIIFDLKLIKWINLKICVIEQITTSFVTESMRKYACYNYMLCNRKMQYFCLEIANIFKQDNSFLNIDLM